MYIYYKQIHFTMGNCKGKETINNNPPKYKKEYDLIERGYAYLIYMNIKEYHFMETTLISNRRNNINIDETYNNIDKINMWEHIKHFTSLLLTANKYLDDDRMISFYFAAILNLDTFDDFIDFVYNYDNNLYKYKIIKHKIAYV